jgi:hypothetical protein
VSTEALTPPKSDADVAAMRARLKEKQQRLMDKIATRKELQAVREQLKKNPRVQTAKIPPRLPTRYNTQTDHPNPHQPPPNRS